MNVKCFHATKDTLNEDQHLCKGPVLSYTHSITTHTVVLGHLGLKPYKPHNLIGSYLKPIFHIMCS